MAQRFWISTGDIREAYETVNIVTSYVVVSEPMLGAPNPARQIREAIDELARQAQSIGANGVLWIDLNLQYRNDFGFGVLASGTAVRVTPKDRAAE